MTSISTRPDSQVTEERRRLFQAEADRWRGVDWVEWLLAVEALLMTLADGGRVAEARAVADDLEAQAMIHAPRGNDWRRILGQAHEWIAYSFDSDGFLRGAVLEHLEALALRSGLPDQGDAIAHIYSMIAGLCHRLQDGDFERAARALSPRERRQLTMIRAIGELRGMKSPDAARLARLEEDLRRDVREAPLDQAALRVGFGENWSVPLHGYGVAQLDDGSLSITRLS
jgi:hypothetical protein